jgi:hypothetical protein
MTFRHPVLEKNPPKMFYNGNASNILDYNRITMILCIGFRFFLTSASNLLETDIANFGVHLFH